MSAAHPHPTNFQGVPPQQPQPNPNLFQPQHPSDVLLQQLKAQVEFYFCPENLANDKFLQSQLNATEHLGAVPIQVICSFRKIRQIYNFATIGIGAGQPSRLDSCNIAVQKAKKFQSSKIKNSIAASDAFFPFADGINTLIKAGVRTIIQPGGSIRDQEIINAANKAKIKMFFTGIRHFNH